MAGWQFLYVGQGEVHRLCKFNTGLCGPAGKGAVHRNPHLCGRHPLPPAAMPAKTTMAAAAAAAGDNGSGSSSSTTTSSDSDGSNGGGGSSGSGSSAWDKRAAGSVQDVLTCMSEPLPPPLWEASAAQPSTSSWPWLCHWEWKFPVSVPVLKLSYMQATAPAPGQCSITLATPTSSKCGRCS